MGLVSLSLSLNNNNNINQIPNVLTPSPCRPYPRTRQSAGTKPSHRHHAWGHGQGLWGPVGNGVGLMSLMRPLESGKF